MRKTIFPIVAAAAVLASPAQAAMFAFSYTGPNPATSASGSGIFTASPNGGNFTITGISGTVDGQAITGLFVPGGFAGNNNILYGTAPVFDFSGVSFSTASANYNLYQDNGSYVGAGYALCSLCGGGNEESLTTFSISAVPEPATWALMLIGFGMIGFTMRKRSNVRTTVSYA